MAFNQSSTKLGKMLFSEKEFNVAGKLRVYKKKPTNTSDNYRRYFNFIAY